MVSLKNFIAEVLPPEALPIAPVTELASPKQRSAPLSLPPGVRVLPREAHCVSRRQISGAALQVLNGLQRAGYQAYLVGGSVRDLLLGREPKDFDVCTDARPEEVRKLFRRNARLIGRRFILVHVQFGQEIIEVATFRGGPEAEAEERSASGRILSDNVYGSFADDAQRRDFTANALYYNIADRSIIDFSTGWDDLHAARLSMIGVAEKRFREDPVRMLRAIRFAAKLSFTLDAEVEAAIAPCQGLLAEVPPARLYEETTKLFLAGFAEPSFASLRQHGLFAALFPQLNTLLDDPQADMARNLVGLALRGTDTRVAEGKSIHPAFLYAALLWPVLQQERAALLAQDKPESIAGQQAAAKVLDENQGQVAIPRRFALTVREIWDLQARFHRRGGRRPFALLTQPRFRAALDFLLLREQAGEALSGLPQWWIDFQNSDVDGRRQLIDSVRNADNGEEPTLGPLSAHKKKRRNRRRRRRGTEASSGDGERQESAPSSADSGDD